MALAQNALVTMAEAKDQLSITTTTPELDARVERWINAASQMIETYLDRKLIYQTYTERKDGRRSDRIILSQFPVVSVVSLHDDINWGFTSTSLIDANDYWIEEDSTIVLKGFFFARGNRNIKIVYSAGYKSPVLGGLGPELPKDLSYACLLTVEWLEKMRNDKRVGVTSKSKNGESISFTNELPLEVRNMIDRYMTYDFPIADSSTGNS